MGFSLFEEERPTPLPFRAFFSRKNDKFSKIYKKMLKYQVFTTIWSHHINSGFASSFLKKNVKKVSKFLIFGKLVSQRPNSNKFYQKITRFGKKL